MTHEPVPDVRRSHVEAAQSRRDFLCRAGCGFGALALAALDQNRAIRASDAIRPTNERAPQAGHLPSRAKSVIWCFLDGGPSHIDLFDPKPELNRLAGELLPDSFQRPVTAMGRTAYTPLLGCNRDFRQHGESGIWVSDWYPEIAQCVDDIAVIRSCKADGLNHVGGVCQMNTGSILGGRPALGAWATYGLGCESRDLPMYVVLLDYLQEPPGGNRNWATGFMPSAFQGTKFRDGSAPILHLESNELTSVDRQRNKIDFIQQLNQRHRLQRAEIDDLEARIAAYELAYRMQAAAPEAVDLREETRQTQELYGLDRKETRRNARNCLLARRLVERGVRFVQLYMGSGSKWDAHEDIEENHSKNCLESDRPIAGLLRDLKQRGLLDETLVVWAGEFGRTPMSESGDGRDHNPYGFTIWMAGGGIKGGTTYGETDEIGLWVTKNEAHVHDIHATVLHCLGLNHLRLTYQHNGRNERSTINGGRVIREILA